MVPQVYCVDWCARRETMITVRIAVVLVACAATLVHGQASSNEEEPAEALEAPARPDNPFLARFYQADRIFARDGSAKGFAAYDALLADASLNPAQRSLVFGRIASRQGAAGDTAKARRTLGSGKSERDKAAAAELL